MGKSVVKNTIYLNIKSAVTTIISLFTTRIVLNALGVDDFGVYGVVAGSVAMLGMFNSALTVSTQRFINFALGKEEQLEQKKIFNNAILLHIGLGLLIVVAIEALYYPMFHGILNIPEDSVPVAKLLYQLMCATTFFTIITIPYEAMINAHEDFLYYSVVGIIESVLKLATALIIVWVSSGRLLIYGVLLAVISVIMMISMRVYCKVKYSECVFSPKAYYDKVILKQLTSFAGWRFIGVFANFFGNYGSNILMNHFFGTIVIAAKNIGDQLGGQLQLVSSNMMRAFNPVIVKAESKGDTQHMLQLSLQACKYGFLLYLVFAVPFIACMPLVLKLWLNTVPEWAVLFCQLQILRLLLEQLTSPLYVSLIAKGDIRTISIYDLILGILTFVTLFIFYYYGAGPTWHYFISIIFLVLLSSVIKLLLCKYKCNLSIKMFFKQVIIPCCLVGISSIIISIFTSYLLSGVINFIATSLIVLSITLALGLSNMDKKHVLTLLKNKLNSFTVFNIK